MRSANGRPRVVVTGLGIVCPLGDRPERLIEALLAGRSGIVRLSGMPAGVYAQIGGDLRDFDLTAHLDSRRDLPADLVRRARRLLRATPPPGQITAAAALQAVCGAGLADGSGGERLGHVLAGHNLNQCYIVDNAMTLREDPEGIEPLYGLYALDTDVLSVVSELVGARGPSFTIGNACASGNIALLTAQDLLRAGRADAVLVTAAPSDLSPVMLQGWALIDALSYRSFNDRPERASRPFDAAREGFVPCMAGAAMMVETLDHARRRGAPVLAEILGAASSSDASRLPKPDHAGQVRSIRLALADAGVSADDVDYVNAHATSTPLGDAVEVAALKTALGRRAYAVPVNSSKSMLGHCLTSAGLVEAVATVLQITAGAVHPTINLDTPDPDLDLDFVPGEARPHAIDVAISNSFGFGGLNSTVVLGRLSS